MCPHASVTAFMFACLCLFMLLPFCIVVHLHFCTTRLYLCFCVWELVFVLRVLACLSSLSLCVRVRLYSLPCVRRFQVFKVWETRVADSLNAEHCGAELHLVAHSNHRANSGGAFRRACGRCCGDGARVQRRWHF